MRRAKTSISTAVAGIGLALATACLAAAPVYAAAASRPERSGGRGGTACPQPPPRVLPDSGTTQTTCVPPTFDSFAATPDPVDYGGSVTLSWSVNSPNPLTCNVSSSFDGYTGGARGSWTTGPITAPTYFQLYCWDAYGDGGTVGLTVDVNGGPGGSSAAAPTGWLDSVTGSGLATGWSCDADSYGTPIYVQLYADGAFLGQTLADADRPDVAAATWACNGTGNHGFSYRLPSYLLNGEPHTIRVYGVNIDVAGHVVGSGDAELSGSPATSTLGGADSTAPTVSITAPADGDVISDSVELTADAVDDVGVAGVRFQLDGRDIGDDLTTAPYAESWNPSGQANGLHTLTAVATDRSGNTASRSITVRLSDSVNDGGGDEETSDSLPAGGQRSLAGSGWCTGRDKAWGTATAPHIQYRNMFTSLLYWKASASVDVCIDTKRHVVVALGHERVNPLYTLPVVWHYDNKPAWSFGPTGSSFTWVQVVDTFTGCPWGLPIGCNKVSFTVVFNIAATGVYSYTVKFH